MGLLFGGLRQGGCGCRRSKQGLLLHVLTSRCAASRVLQWMAVAWTLLPQILSGIQLGQLLQRAVQRSLAGMILLQSCFKLLDELLQVVPLQ